MSRGQFLKGVGGAVVAMSVLSGAGEFASTALAAKKHGGSANGGKIENLTGDQLRKAIQMVGDDTQGRVLQSSLSGKGFRFDKNKTVGNSITSSRDTKKTGTVVVLPYRHQDGRTAHLIFSKVGDKALFATSSIFSADGKSLEGYAVVDGQAKLVKRVKDIEKARRRLLRRSRSSQSANREGIPQEATTQARGGTTDQVATAQEDQYGSSLQCDVCKFVANLLLDTTCSEIIQQLAKGAIVSLICGGAAPECAAAVASAITAFCAGFFAVSGSAQQSCQALGFC